jgi:hypothetical protein
MLSSLPFECPPELLEKGRAGSPAPTAIVGAGGELAMQSARLAWEAGLIEPCLVGDPRRIAARRPPRGPPSPWPAAPRSRP